MVSFRVLVALVLLAGSSACAGRSIDDGGEAGRGGSESAQSGSYSGGASSGGAGSSGPGGTGSGAGGSASGGGSLGGSGASAGAPSECTRLDDELPLSVSVEIHNDTSRPLHLGPTSPTCGTSPLFLVADAAGTPLGGLGSCRTSCQVLREHGAGGCAAFCPGWDTVTLQPGEVLYTTWAGQYRTDALMPASCVSGGYPESSSLMCDKATTIQAGRYTFSAQAFTTRSCADTDTCSACAPSAQGGCATPNTTVGGEMKVAVTTAELGRVYGALGIPLPDSAPGASPEIPRLNLVRLFFTE